MGGRGAHYGSHTKVYRKWKFSLGVYYYPLLCFHSSALSKITLSVNNACAKSKQSYLPRLLLYCFIYLKQYADTFRYINKIRFISK